MIIEKVDCFKPGDGREPQLTSSPGFCFFHLVRRFWNQILTWNSRLDDFLILKPDFQLEFHLRLSEVEGESQVEPFTNREISRRLELVLKAHLRDNLVDSSNFPIHQINIIHKCTANRNQLLISKSLPVAHK